MSASSAPLTAPQTFPLDAADAVLYRWDAVVIETDPEDRENTIKVIKGTPAAETAAAKPTLSANQHPLCYIRVTPGLTKLTQSNIENRVGLSDCPYIVGVVKTVDVSQLFAQWEDDFTTWFSALQANLSGNVAANLQRQITENANAISDLSGAIDGKADAETVESLVANVGTGGQNCRIQYGNYVGTDTHDSSNPISLTFDFYPIAVFVKDEGSGQPTIILREVTTTSTGSGFRLVVSWENNGVSWYGREDTGSRMLDGKNTTYYYFAIGYSNS